MLKLLTNHLVTALKSSTTPLELNKISFAIQEILALTNQCSNDISSNEQNIDFSNVDSVEKNSHGVMNKWLEDILKKEGVYEDLETFWESDFQQVRVLILCVFVEKEKRLNKKYYDLFTFLWKNDKIESRKPPFFENSPSYFSWITDWSRFMVESSFRCERSRWKRFFYAMRSAVRSPSAVDIVEFLLPLLVLDRLCFGNDEDKQIAMNELRAALSYNVNDHAGLRPRLDSFEMTKVVGVALMIIDTLNLWAEKEIESRSKVVRGETQMSLPLTIGGSLSFRGNEFEWDAEESVGYILDLMTEIPLSLRADAASSVGMYARALQLIEIHCRSFETAETFDEPLVVEENDSSRMQRNSIDGYHLEGANFVLVHKVLGELKDFDSMKSVAQFCERKGTKRMLLDQIREKEISGDWIGALYLYEQALQIDEQNENKVSLELGLVNALLQLGQLETALNQVNGILSNQSFSSADSDFKELIGNKHEENMSQVFIPPAAEAAWRLGRWNILDDLLKSLSRKETNDSRQLSNDGRFQINMSNAMLGLHKKSIEVVRSSIHSAREAVMTLLAPVASESYRHVYPQLIRLHCLREIENAADILCSDQRILEYHNFSTLVTADSPDSWSWDRRLNLVATDMIGSALVSNSRLTLTRLANDSLIEGRLWMTVGKRARKNSLFTIASNSLIHADLAFGRAEEDPALNLSTSKRDSYSFVYQYKTNVNIQLAKLKYSTGQSNAAFQQLGIDDNMINLASQGTEDAQKALEGEKSADEAKILARKILISTEWMVEGGLKSGTEALNMYRSVKKIHPKWERGKVTLVFVLSSVIVSTCILR